MRLLPIASLVLAAAAAAEEPATPPVPPPIALPRASGPIVVDGDLEDPGWRGAAVIDAFFETVFGDNRAPLVTTVALVAYDDRYFYVAVRCDDPEPRRIRAPYVERDEVLGTDDNVAIFLDTRNDRRSAQEFRVNPRGVQADAVYNDANGNEDFSPDFFYDSAARITATGWQAELRIPLSSLRYAAANPQSWGIIVWRNYPRDRRYAIYSSPTPRGANCTICWSRELTGISGLPSASHLVLAPYVSASDARSAPAPGAPLSGGDAEADAGLDVKWTPGAALAVDAALNPDFSQIESDVAQIAVNQRFALFYPEKRPFFLEGVDLFDTPIQAVYTRTITSPRWGARATGKLGATAYTALLAQDRGGGSVVLPGSEESSFAPQDFESFVGVARLRRDFGASFGGLLLTDREIEGGGFNRVLGPDGLWRRGAESVSGQLLLSDTETPNRPQDAAEWDGRRLSSHALKLAWNHQTPGIAWELQYADVGDDFRADVGFVPQVGYRKAQAQIGYAFYPSGFLSLFRPLLVAERVLDRQGELLSESVVPLILALGRRNLQADVELAFDRLKTGAVVLPRTQLLLNVQVDPGRHVPRVGVQGFLGEDVDLAQPRVGTGGRLTAFATLRPDAHFTLDATSAFSWLDVDEPGATGRLFTAQVQRLKATWSFNPRCFVRLVGQYQETEREPALYAQPVPAREAFFSGSALFGYRLNWQTALYLGYGDERALDERDQLSPTDRQLFFKLSYAFQR